MDILNLIKQRRSIRHFKTDDVPHELIITILEAGRWAPSGLNNQPWRFVIVKSNNIKQKLASCTKYSRIIKDSNACICVFYHILSGYNRDKDLMSIGACIQNMLLTIHQLDLGAVWLGEILNQKDKVNEILNIDNNHELAAVIALGYPDEKGSSNRKNLNDLILKPML